MHNTTKQLVQILLAIDRSDVLYIVKEGEPMPTSSHSHFSTACMTCVNQTFVPSPKSQFEPSGVDPITVTHTPAMVKRGQDTSSDVRVPYIFTNKQNSRYYCKHACNV